MDRSADRAPGRLRYFFAVPNFDLVDRAHPPVLGWSTAPAIIGLEQFSLRLKIIDCPYDQPTAPQKPVATKKSTSGS
jgi:hypothetical protein